MNYTLTILERDHDSLTRHLFARPEERAAFLLCRQARTDDGTTLLVRSVVPVRDEDVTSSSATHMSIGSSAYIPLLKQANDHSCSIVFVHSHPQEHRDFSPQDDREEPIFFRTAYNRIHHDVVHGSLVLTAPLEMRGRVWLEDGTQAPIHRVRIIGRRFHFIDRNRQLVEDAEVFDRQARAFGAKLQPLLKSLHIGVVGHGGTGSAVLEQLVRLGFGTITVIDPQRLERSNVSRVYGSSINDHGRPKTDIALTSARHIGLGTSVVPIEGDVTFKSVAKLLRNCDAIFGCTDDEWGRSVLNNVALFYGIPVFDMGIQIDSSEGAIRAIEGRVTTLLPGTACLYCRKRITSQAVAHETIRALDPERAEALVKEGYIAGVAEPAPAVITFTTGIAAAAVSELLNRLIGFMDPDRDASEVLYFFDQTRIRMNSTPPDDACFCSNSGNWLRGDEVRFLSLNWRPE